MSKYAKYARTSIPMTEFELPTLWTEAESIKAMPKAVGKRKNL